MATITTRAGKGSPLTNTEVDNNFTNLNTAKYESGNNVSFGTVASGATTITSGTADGLTINHDTFKKGLILHRNHASNAASIVFKNNSSQHGVLFSTSDTHLYYRMGTSETNNKIWHAGNDGAGSGLDADLLDGAHRQDVIQQLARTVITSTSDLNTLSGYGWYGWGSSNPSNSPADYGVLRYLSDGSQDQQWVTAYGGAANKVELYGRRKTSGNWDTSWTRFWSDKNDGAGSGLDADTVDGIQASSFLRSDADDTTTGHLTFSDSGYSIGNEYHTWKRAYAVRTGEPDELLYKDGNSLPNGGAYRFHAHIDGTGTDQSATAVYWNQNGTWKLNVTYQSGTSSNHPEFIIDGGVPKISIDHTSNYTVQVLGERLELSESTGTDNKSGFGTDAYFSVNNTTLRFNPSGAGAINTGDLVWHAGNDGSGSGLDADTVDGLSSGSFLRSDATDTSSGKLTFQYSLNNLNSVSGPRGVTPFVGSFQASNRPSTSGNYATGLEFTYYDTGARGQLVFSSNGNNTTPHIYARTEGWSATDGWQNWVKLFHTGNDGSGSGLDADLLDGLDSTAFQKISEKEFFSITNSGTTAGTWLGSHDDITSYFDGMTIAFYQNNVAGASTTTININNLGAKTIYYANDSKLTTHYGNRSLIMLQYDSDQDRFYAHDFYYSDANYNLRWNLDITVNNSAGTGTAVHGYQILLEGTDGKFYPCTEGGSTGNTNAVSTADLKIGGTMLIYNSSTDYSANATLTSSSLWAALETGTMEYWNNRDSGWATPDRPIYFVGEVQSNGSYKLDNTSYTSFLTQDLPTTDDGKIYIKIGWMADNYDDYRLENNHPIYVYKDGSIKEYAGYADYAGDADTVDGYHASQFVTTSGGISSNLDTEYRAGMKGWSPSTSGTKPTDSYGQIISIVNSGSTHNNSNNWITQLGFGTGQNSAYFRSKTNSGSWGGWKTIWHTGNDGSGSGLDADTVDSLHASTFFRKDTANTIVSTTTFSTLDSIFLRTGGNGNSDTTLWRCNGNAATNNSGDYGFTVKYMGTRSGVNNSFSIFSDNLNSSTQIEAFQINQDGTLKNAGNKIWTEGNDGPGSTLHADLLDGQHGSYYLDYNNFTNTPSGGGGGSTGPAFFAKKHVSGSGPPQYITPNTYTKVTFTVEDIDTDSDFTNSRFTPQTAGYYWIHANLYCAVGAGALNTAIYKNGSAQVVSSYVEEQSYSAKGTVSGLVYLNGSTDYVEAYVLLQNAPGTSSNASVQLNRSSYFTGFLAR